MGPHQAARSRRSVPGFPGRRRRIGLCYCRAMDQKTIDRAAAVIAAIALIVGLSTIVWGRFDSGIRLATSGQYVVVSEVQPRSIASQYGLRPGMIVTELQGVTLVKLPQYIWP